MISSETKLVIAFSLNLLFNFSINSSENPRKAWKIIQKDFHEWINE